MIKAYLFIVLSCNVVVCNTVYLMVYMQHNTNILGFLLMQIEG